ncbi:hypothetical protein QOZ95_003593 [Paenibacillus brasilensis]|uniref:Uncharacterized protein n=1 Tax=Paenibacillus brasilensis TaxID=128574 RepID=A0ABU0L389_9BACL|nr:hypothetical protein [Paenibacillus brasilensis]
MPADHAPDGQARTVDFPQQGLLLDDEIFCAAVEESVFCV